MKKNKKLMGILFVVVGIAAIVLSYVIRSRVGEEMGGVHAITNPLSQTGQAGRTVGGIIEGRATGEAAGYLRTAQVLMVGGIVLIVIGGCTVFFCKKKK